jgi:xanthine dehydrogenase large subunit
MDRYSEKRMRLLLFFEDEKKVIFGHQGIEMGQGLHSKMCQVVAHELGVDISRVRVASNNTDMLGHTMFDTGGSVGTEVSLFFPPVLAIAILFDDAFR